MNRTRLRKLILDIAREMNRERSTITHEVVSVNEIVIDVDGYVLIELKITTGIHCTFKLHPKVEQRGVEADKELIESAKCLFDQTLLALFKEEIPLYEKL